MIRMGAMDEVEEVSFKKVEEALRMMNRNWAAGVDVMIDAAGEIWVS